MPDSTYRSYALGAWDGLCDNLCRPGSGVEQRIAYRIGYKDYKAS
jgi:hypothetical protein